MKKEREPETPADEKKNRLPGRFRLPFCDDSNSCINAM